MKIPKFFKKAAAFVVAAVTALPSIRSLGLICRLTIDTERSKSSRPLAER